MRPTFRHASHRDLCNHTAHLRRRAQDAEARLIPLEQERDAANVHANQLSVQIRAERAALIHYLESPAWERELLLLAQERFRAVVMEALMARKSCAACGGLGRGAYDSLFEDAIAEITDTHALPPVNERPDIAWPLRKGSVSREGKMLKSEWLSGG